MFVPVPDAPGRTAAGCTSTWPAATAEHQRETVARLLASGATRADIGQGDVPGRCCATRRAHLFCVLEPRPVYAAGAVAAVVVQAVDPERMVAFWQAATGWERSDTELVALRSPGGVYLELYPVDDLPDRDWTGCTWTSGRCPARRRPTRWPAAPRSAPRRWTSVRATSRGR